MLVLDIKCKSTDKQLFLPKQIYYTQKSNFTCLINSVVHGYLCKSLFSIFEIGIFYHFQAVKTAMDSLVDLILLNCDGN